jgi:hypothetical protein
MSDNLGNFAPPLSEFEAWYCSDELMWWTSWPSHVGGWLARAEGNPNVLILRFEHITHDMRAAARRISDFLGMNPLLDPELSQIERKCGFEYMREHAETFEMSPPHLLQADGKFFFSGKANRYESVPAAMRERVIGWCRDRMPAGKLEELGYHDRETKR